jgi:hypothetical protein
MSGYRASVIAEYYDRYGDREWARFERMPLDEVKLPVHLAHLRRYVRSGMRVLVALTLEHTLLPPDCVRTGRGPANEDRAGRD